MPAQTTLRRGRTLVNDDGVRYRIEYKLAAGGFGTVYVASLMYKTGGRVRKTVCVKVCDSATDWHGEAFFGRVTSARPQVVTLFDSFVETSGRARLYVLVFEYLREGTLEGVLDGTRWEPNDARAAIAGILELLEDLHAVGITHRDIKPSNVLLRDGTLVLGDFGIAKLCLPEDLSPVDAFTPDFSPQDMDRRLEWAAWVDIFQVGLLLYSLLDGEVRTQQDIAALGHLDAPDDLLCWIWHATSNKGMRYADAADALSALMQLPRVPMQPAGSVGRLHDQRVVVTGKFDSFTQPQLIKRLRSSGAEVQKAVNDDTTLLIRGDLNNAMGVAEGRKLFAVRERRRRGQRIKIADEWRVLKVLAKS